MERLTQTQIKEFLNVPLSMCAGEIDVRYKKRFSFDHVKQITTSHDASDYIRSIYDLEEKDIYLREHLGIIFLNRANKIISYKMLFSGGTAGTVTDIKLIAILALRTLASGVIMFHNHPSENTSPSEADKVITQKVAAALRTLDIRLLDHIIIGGERYFSFADENLL